MGVQGRDNLGRNQNDQLGGRPLVLHGTEQGSNYRQVADARHPTGQPAVPLAQQTGDGDRLAVSNLHRGFTRPRPQARHDESLDLNRRRKVKLRYLGSDAQPDAQRLDDLKSRLRYGFLMRLDTPDRVASSLARIVAITGGLDAVDALYETYAAVTPEDVQSAAKRYLTPTRRTVATLRGAD